MTIEAELLELLESTVTITPMASQRADGKPQAGTPVTVQAHVQLKRHMVRNEAGQEVVAQGLCFLDDAYPWVNEQAQLLLPDGKTAVLIAVETTYGPNLDTGTNGPYQTILHY